MKGTQSTKYIKIGVRYAAIRCKKTLKEFTLGITKPVIRRLARRGGVKC